MKVLFSSFQKNGPTAWFDPQTNKWSHCMVLFMTLLWLILVIQLKQVCIDIFSQLNIDFPQYGAKVFFPDDAFANSSTTFATTVVYRTLNDILRLQAEEGSVEGSNDRRRTQMSGSNIVSASVVPRIPQPLRKPIKLVLSHKNKVTVVLFIHKKQEP